MGGDSRPIFYSETFCANPWPLPQEAERFARVKDLSTKPFKNANQRKNIILWEGCPPFPKSSWVHWRRELYSLRNIASIEGPTVLSHSPQVSLSTWCLMNKTSFHSALKCTVTLTSHLVTFTSSPQLQSELCWGLSTSFGSYFSTGAMFRGRNRQF